MTYAIIEIGGKQIKVFEGEPIWTEKLNNKVDENIVLDKVLAYYDGKKLQIGKPYLDNVKVQAKVEKQGRMKKIIILRTKQKSNWKRKQGHRQPYTRLMINKIEV